MLEHIHGPTATPTPRPSPLARASPACQLEWVAFVPWQRRSSFAQMTDPSQAEPACRACTGPDPPGKPGMSGATLSLSQCILSYCESYWWVSLGDGPQTNASQ